MPFTVLRRCAVLLALLPAALFAAMPTDPDSVRLGQSLDDYFTRAEAFGFSGSVIVARGDQQLLRKGYGYADRRAGVANTPETVFGLSSGDKQIIAAAIMRLQEMGRLRVSDTLGRFFSGLPAEKASITLRQVLSHTSGIPNEYWDDHKDLARDAFVGVVLGMPLVFPPGTRWAYSNANYWLLEEVIARASAEPYERFIDEQLFRPAGMLATGLPSKGWAGNTIATYRPWTFDFPPGRMPDAEPLLERARSNWQVMTTVDDLYQWYLALRGNTVISKQSKEDMFTPVRDGYGYGWNILRTRRNTKVVYHGGASTNIGMTAEIRWWVDEDVILIILANSTNPSVTADVVAPAVEAIVFGGVPGLPPATVARVAGPSTPTGTFRLSDGGTFAIKSASGGRLVAQSMDPRGILDLILPDVAAPLDSGTYDRDAESALAAAFRGDFEPMRRVVSPEEDFEARRVGMVRLVGRYKALGQFSSARTVYQRGYDRDGVPEIQSFVHLAFSGGDAIVRVVQLSNGQTYFNPQQLPPMVEFPLALSPGGRLTAWNFLWGTGAQLMFESAGGDRVDVRGSRAVLHGSKP